MPADEVRRRFKHPLLQPVLDFAEVWFKERDRITFHDPLAAAVIFDESLCTFEKGQVEVETEGASPGRTEWTPNPQGRHEAATKVNASAFFDHYFSLFPLDETTR
ncbi:hypothetical protein HQ520_15550 [bacterium]|nr:hypothetical protein [bacterium]